MLETIELRINEEHAWRVLAPDEGVRMGLVRRVVLPTSDPRLPEIVRLRRELWASGQGLLYFGWSIQRDYSGEELAAAELLHVQVNSVFEPAGEETGTVYDEADTCPFCGAGRRQLGDLCLDVRRIPKRADLARTIANEVVMSTTLAEVLAHEGMTGLEFGDVRHRDPNGVVSPDWRQPRVASQPIEVADLTGLAGDVFEPDSVGQYRCRLGHTLGVNLITELFLDRATWSGEDFCSTRQFVGANVGLFRPTPCSLVSQRLYQLLVAEKAHGFKVEVAHLV